MIASPLFGQTAALLGVQDYNNLAHVMDAWPVFFAGGVAPYLALRIRDAAADRSDPDLGIKVVYHAVFSGGIVFALMGLARFVGRVAMFHMGSSVPTASPGVPEPSRVALPMFEVSGLVDPFAMIATGVSGSAVAAGLIRWATNMKEFPAVRRVYVGARLVVCGLHFGTVVLNLNGVLASRLQHGTSSLPYGSAADLGYLAVWGPALGFHVWLMHRLRGLPYYRGPAD